MPWQQEVVDVALELHPDGRPVYRDVGVVVPRQSGKTTLVLGVEIERALFWDEPQHVSYSAQTGADGRKKLVDDQFPLLERHRAVLGIRRFRRQNGLEGIDWRNGSRLSVMASSIISGHGPTIDLGMKDELFADTDFRRDQALIPAMATRERAQAWNLSTAGTDASVALAKVVQLGRAAVDAGTTSGIAYFEWSAPEGVDPDDENEWLRCMPALGHTISLEVVRHARRTLDEPEFMRAFLNIPTGSVDGRVIDLNSWDAVNYGLTSTGKPIISPAGDLVFAVDCNPERSAASVGCCDGTGRIELVEYRSGTGWLVERVAALSERWAVPFAIDPGGPAATFIPDLERAGVKLIEVGGREVAQACGAFYDDVVEGLVRVNRHPVLDDAVTGARKRTSGDAWAWARRDQTVDVSPLVAVTFASWLACHVGVKRAVYAY